jgi:hypothetical protein
MNVLHLTHAGFLTQSFRQPNDLASDTRIRARMGHCLGLAIGGAEDFMEHNGCSVCRYMNDDFGVIDHLNH